MIVGKFCLDDKRCLINIGQEYHFEVKFLMNSSDELAEQIPTTHA